MEEVIKYFESLEARIAALEEAQQTNEAVIASLEAEVEELKSRPAAEPQVVEKIVEKPVEVIKEVVVEKPVEVIKEVIVEKPVKEEPQPVVEPAPLRQRRCCTASRSMISVRPSRSATVSCTNVSCSVKTPS